MKLPTIVLGLVLSTLAADARSGPQVTTQTRAVSAFKRIDLRAPFRTEVHEGRAVRVTVQLDDSYQQNLVTRVSGDTLIVEFNANGNVHISDPALVSIDVPSLSGITLEGPGSTSVDGAGAHPEVDVAVEGPGGLHWTGDADLVRLELDGPGGTVLRGSGKRMEAHVSGPGSLDARAFAVTAGSFEITGPGGVTADLHGGDVSVVVSGPGSFRYSGDAHFTRKEVNGVGGIHKL
jgi:hypothetical protein